MNSSGSEHVIGHRSHLGASTLPDTILFDWDDTLYDHAHLLPISSQIFIDRYMPVGTTIDQLNGEWHNNKKAFCERYFSGRTPEYITHELWAPLMHEIDRDEWRLKEGAQSLIKSLKNRGISLGIVSNKPKEKLMEEVRHFGLENDFDVIIGHEKNGGTKTKPAPDLVQQALGSFSMKPRSCWYLGDHPDDYGATRHNGIELHVIGSKYSGKIATYQLSTNDQQPIRYFECLSDFISYFECIASAVRTR